MKYTIENEEIRCEIDSHGAELKSLVRKADGREVMWKADPACWNRTSPVLFAFVCIEPWYGRCDSAPFAGDLKDRDHEQKLIPGETFRAEYVISL